MQHWLEKVVELLTANTSDLRELARIAGGNPETFYLGIQQNELDLEGQDMRGFGFGDLVSNRVSMIRNAKNRGERLSILLDTIFQDRSIGLQVLDRYPTDKSKYEFLSVIALRNALSTESQINRIDNVTLVRTVRAPLVHQLSTSRASLLFYMAKYLSKYPDVKLYLRQLWGRTTSVEYNRYRNQINEYLK